MTKTEWESWTSPSFFKFSEVKLRKALYLITEISYFCWQKCFKCAWAKLTAYIGRDAIFYN